MNLPGNLTSTRRLGLTIIEVLVALLIVGLLLALLLPAAQAARENARRAQCASNLRQVALAVQVYEQTHQRIPALYNGPCGTGLP
jgi:prepilin-type N-terminal cleavage/methylation domain-containing protein